MLIHMHSAVTVIAKYFIIIPVLVLVVEFIRLDAKKRLNLLIFVAVSAVVTVLLVKLATTLHSDPRPFVRDGVTPYFSSSTDNGFPSDHTTFSAVIAFCVLKYSRKLGISLAILSLVIGSARVVGGVHHTQDIIGGFIIAALGVAVCSVALSAISRRKSKDTSQP